MTRVKITCIGGGKGKRRKLGLGDAVHLIAGPVARVIHWPCLKGDGTTDLKPGSPCDQAREKLNKFSV